MGRDPEELAATLRELARLDPVESASRRCWSGSCRPPRPAAAAPRRRPAPARLRRQAPLRRRGGGPRRWLAGTQVRLARRPVGGRVLAGGAGVQQRSCRRASLARFRPLALAAGIRAWLSVPCTSATAPSARSTSPAPTPAVAAPRPSGRRRLRPAAGGDPAAGHRTAAGAALPGATVRGPARRPGSSRRVALSCSANGSTSPLQSSCYISRPRSRANRSSRAERLLARPPP